MTLLLASLLSAPPSAVQSAPSDDVVKVYVSPAADLTILDHPDYADSNFGGEESLDVGYLFTEWESCSDGGPCLVTLERWDAITLLKYKLPDPGDWEVKRVFLIIPATHLQYDLPGDEYPKLCRFAVAKFNHVFLEYESSWGHWMEGGGSWSPWDWVDPVAAFYVTPSTGSPIVVDLTAELKDEIQGGGNLEGGLYMALTPAPESEGYEPYPGMTCQLYSTSEESDQGGPVLYIEYGPHEYEVEEIAPPDIPFIPQAPLVPPDLWEAISSIAGGEEEPVPLPNVPWDQIPVIPKIPPPQVPITPIPTPTFTPPPTTPPPQEYPPTFSLQVSPDLQSVQAGGAVTFTVYVIPHFGFSDWVQLSASGGPAGSSVTLTPPSVNPAAAAKPEATLTVQIPGWAPPGNYLVTAVGQSGGLVDSASAWVMVQPKPGGPEQPPAGAEGDFYLTVYPEEETKIQGSAATFEVHVQPVGDFKDEVHVFLVNPPQGSMFIVHGASVHPGDVAHVRVLPTEDTPPGTYELTIAAAGGGIHKSASALLRVESKAGAETQPPPGGAAAAIELLVGEASLSAPPSQKKRTWLAVSLLQGQADVASFEVVYADPGLHYELSAQQAPPGGRVLIYLWADSPGNYAVRVRATAAGAQDEKVIALSVSGAGGGPERSPPPRTVGGGVGPLGIRLWPDLVVALLAAAVALLSLLVIVVSRRRTEEPSQSP